MVARTLIHHPITRNMIIAAAILVVFAMVGAGLVAGTFMGTREIIAATERAALLDNLNSLVPPGQYDNQPTRDTLEITAPQALGTAEPVTVYRARQGGEPVALFATPVAPDGYGGPIRLLVGVYTDGQLAGVRALAHKETPGLGDAIEVERNQWILGFAGQSLNDPAPAAWAVRKDGGAFDQFTGATITPRAVVGAVRRFLVYFDANRDRLFATRQEVRVEPATPPPPQPLPGATPLPQPQETTP